MANLEIQVCLISARSLPKMTSSLVKLQWFAVAWIDPNNKYCTKLTSSRNSISIWNTKFLAMIDETNAGNDLVLHVEVYSRESLFLRETLEGEAVVGLKEFLEKYVKRFEGGDHVGEEVGSFQLRRRKSGKARGFVDVAILIRKERDDAKNLTLGTGEGFQLINRITGTGGFQRDQTGSSNWTTLSGP